MTTRQRVEAAFGSLSPRLRRRKPVSPATFSKPNQSLPEVLPEATTPPSAAAQEGPVLPTDKSTYRGPREQKKSGSRFLRLKNKTLADTHKWKANLMSRIFKPQRGEEGEEDGETQDSQKPADRKRRHSIGSSAGSGLLEATRARSRQVKLPQFGMTLVELQELYGEQPFGVPLLVSTCVEYLKKDAMKVKGIFRISGQHSLIMCLKLTLEDGDIESLLSCDDPHSIAGLLRLFFRELPEPVIPTTCSQQLVTALEAPDGTKQIVEVRACIEELPLPNLVTLAYLLEFLNEVASFADCNQMGVSNIALVFAPSLVRADTENLELLLTLSSSGNFVFS